MSDADGVARAPEGGSSHQRGEGRNDILSSFPRGPSSTQFTRGPRSVVVRGSLVAFLHPGMGSDSKEDQYRAVSVDSSDGSQWIDVRRGAQFRNERPDSRGGYRNSGCPHPTVALRLTSPSSLADITDLRSSPGGHDGNICLPRAGPYRGFYRVCVPRLAPGCDLPSPETSV